MLNKSLDFTDVGGDAGGAGSEDCLKVNVYAPVGARKGDNRMSPCSMEERSSCASHFTTSPRAGLHSRRRYVQQGPTARSCAFSNRSRAPGYTYGNPRNWPFDHWIHQSPDVIIASVYYRLDSFGFLAGPSSDVDLNAGFQDQIQALRWVQEHISAFGGDPRRVTIDGESAGGSSIELHLVSPASRGLFAQAILQSVYRTPVPAPAQQKVSALCVQDELSRMLMMLTSPAAFRLLCEAGWLRKQAYLDEESAGLSTEGADQRTRAGARRRDIQLVRFAQPLLCRCRIVTVSAARAPTTPSIPCSTAKSSPSSRQYPSSRATLPTCPS